MKQVAYAVGYTDDMDLCPVHEGDSLYPPNRILYYKGL
ncbi:hypothetical protein FHS14_005008 [Paenibacillus baekrokdamisoli]|nr:hypothetical protein [Paenibacillus baekrokdamisoli]